VTAVTAVDLKLTTQLSIPNLLPLFLNLHSLLYQSLTQAQLQIPQALVGTWVGSFSAPFGFTDLSKDESWECSFGPPDFPQPLVTVKDNSIELTIDNRLILGPWKETSVTSPPFNTEGLTRTWSWPAETIYDELVIVSYNSTNKILKLRYPEDPLEEYFCRYLDLIPAIDTLPSSLVLADVESSDLGMDACLQASYPGRPLCMVRNDTKGGLVITTSQVGRYFKALPSSSPGPSLPLQLSSSLPSSVPQSPSLMGSIPLSSTLPLHPQHIPSSATQTPLAVSRFDSMDNFDSPSSGASSTASFSFIVGFCSALALARMGF